MTFGEVLKRRRLGHNLSLRAFSEKHGYDFGNQSKLERGLLNPPDNVDWMENMAAALGLVRNTAEWFEFHDLATIARRQIPKSLLDDAEVARKLPVLFRTLQGERLAEGKMDELIDFIRSKQ